MNHPIRRLVPILIPSLVALPWAGCSSSDEANSTVGGANSTVGGAASGSGGASGGQTATGGIASSSGGASATFGGQVAAGGMSNANGGVISGSDGRSASGGGSTNATGGAGSGMGGRSGGATSGGVGSGTGGAGSAVGGGSNDAAAPSTGCGKAAALMNGRASIDVSGEEREYVLALPDDYDETQPYRLVFGWHPLGGSAEQVAKGGYYGLQSQSKGSAIFVSPEGLPFSGTNLGWGNQNGGDLEFLQAMLERFRAELCIDENRIFSTGFSFGGMFSFATACSPDSMMRAVAPMAGNTMVSGCASGTRPVALMGFHGTEDNVVAIDGGRRGRDILLERNQCSETSTPVDAGWCAGVGQNYQPCTCVSYEGCSDGYPVIWCEFQGSHLPAPNSAATIWSFFSQF